MGGKAAISLGLVTGLVAGGLIVGAVIALTPPPPAPVIATNAPPSTPPSTPPSPSLSPSASPGVPSGGPVGSGGEPSPSTPGTEAFGIGGPAPPLVLPLVGGESVDLADDLGAPVWVTFMDSDCAACVDELPLMNGFHARYGEATGLVVLAVDVAEDEATAQAFFGDLGIDVPVALDEDGAAHEAWGALALPVHFWIDEDGIIRDGAQGGIGPEVMAQGLESILDVEVTP